MQIQPQCMTCYHLALTSLTCKAFPEGIPDDILYNRVSHTEPVPGDHGVRYRKMTEEEEEARDQQLDLLDEAESNSSS